MFLSPTILPIQYPLHVATARRVHLPSPTYLHEDEEEAGGLPGTKKTDKYREDNTKLLETFTEKKEYEIPDVFCLFVCMIYPFNSQYEKSLNL